MELGGASTREDLAVLEAAVELTPRRVNVSATRVSELPRERASGPTDLVSLRLAVLRLERDGLLRSDARLNLEPTPDGRVAVDLLRLQRRSGSRRSA